MAGELEQLMYSYCSEFPKLYPSVSIKPKMHVVQHGQDSRNGMYLPDGNRLYDDEEVTDNEIVGEKVTIHG